jgi:uncharacterized membrane protein YbaN (DUF454 family)
MGKKEKQIKTIDNRFIRGILIISGTIFVGIGMIGIIVPILPTTPFLLLAAACYLRSSEKFYNWLLNNKRFGPYITNYLEGKGLPLKIKLYAISMMWIMILLSIILFVENLFIRIILIIIAILVSIYLITIKTKKT